MIAKILLFPDVGQDAADFKRMATFLPTEVHVCPLPTIHDPTFAEEFAKAVAWTGATYLYCPVASVFHFMQTFPHGLTLIGESPIKREMRQHDELMNLTRSVMHLAGSHFSLVEVAGVLKQAMSIYGESNPQKIAAMMGIFHNLPSGDTVEIGSLCGRTAFVLRWLARRCGVGPVITIDPWSAVDGIQHDSPPLLEVMTLEWNWDTVAESFATSMVPLGSYWKHKRAPSAAVGKQYTGDIAVLHIDGNHDYTYVKQDIDLWTPHIITGGWLILDDYLWPHGDGPRRAGDELLEMKLHDRHFERGGALFMRLK